MLFFYFQDWLYWYLTWSPGESIGVTVRSGFSSSEMNKTWTKAVMSKFTLFRPGGKCWLLHWQNLWLSRWIQNYSFPLRTENVQFEDFTTDNKFGIIYLFIYCFFKKTVNCCVFQNDCSAEALSSTFQWRYCHDRQWEAPSSQEVCRKKVAITTTRHTYVNVFFSS